MLNKVKNLVTLDFETYFSKRYSLKSKDLNTSGYIKHPEFKVQCTGLKVDDGKPVYVDSETTPIALDTIDWETTALLCHHTQFDGFILKHHFNITPAFYFDTLSMGRALHSTGIGASLNALAGHYNLGNKLPDVLEKTKGIHNLEPELLTQLGTYCALDVELCYLLFKEMINTFPVKELELIDMTIRMFCDPVLKIDTARVTEELNKEISYKEKLIADSNAEPAVLRSNQKFAKLLESMDIEVPMKTSLTTGKETYAFAKADLAFQALEKHPDPKISNLIKARIAVKSSIGETRAQRFLDEAQNDEPLPVYLKYYGAHTGRWSAGNKMNLQNLKRGGELRRSILAPKGYKVIVADSAQIEARVLAWFAGQKDILQAFAEGKDNYKIMASLIYGVPIEEIVKQQRFIGKIAVLGLGYGMGAAKFKNTLETGAMGPPINITDNEAFTIVTKFRKTRKQIVQCWDDVNRFLHKMYLNQDHTHGPCFIKASENKIYLPNGMYLQYPGLSCDYDPDTHRMVDFVYFDYENASKMDKGISPNWKKAKRIYGGLLTENIVQALARIIISDQMAEVAKHYKIVTMTHDEIVAIAPEKEADQALNTMLTIMRTPPEWCKDIPLDAEGGFDDNYSK